MNSDPGPPASLNYREESGMDSGHGARGSNAEPMRVACMRPTDSEFRVAESEDGGTTQGNLYSSCHCFIPSLPSVRSYFFLYCTLTLSSSYLLDRSGKVSHRQVNPFNAPVHLLHDPKKAVVFLQSVSVHTLCKQTLNQ